MLFNRYIKKIKINNKLLTIQSNMVKGIHIWIKQILHTKQNCHYFNAIYSTSYRHKLKKNHNIYVCRGDAVCMLFARFPSPTHKYPSNNPLRLWANELIVFFDFLAVFYYLPLYIIGLSTPFMLCLIPWLVF
jgi:hypothetical protein